MNLTRARKPDVLTGQKAGKVHESGHARNFPIGKVFLQNVKWARRDSNPRPSGYEPDALTWLSYGPSAGIFIDLNLKFVDTGTVDAHQKPINLYPEDG